ncbi:hypothetical protein Tco_0608786 [Tanacetum coccineum]
MELNLNVYTEKNGLVVIGLSSDGNMSVMKTWFKYPLAQLERAERYAFLLGLGVVFGPWFAIINLYLYTEGVSDAEESIYAEGSMYAEGFMDVECSMYVEGFLI